MSHFIVEHRTPGSYTLDVITGVEDLDTSQFKELIGIWVCDSEEECRIMKKELLEMRHARSSQSS